MDSKSVAQANKAKKAKKARKIWSMLALGLVILCVAVLVFLGLSQLFQNNETRISSAGENNNLEIMICETATPKDPFFSVAGATEVEHQIKLTYRGERADKISYEYEAELGSPEAVSAAEAQTHADYNIYMGDHANDFSTQFMPMGNEYKISIYADVDDLGSGTARMFFISAEDFAGLEDYKVEDLRKIIQTAGFHCEMSED